MDRLSFGQRDAASKWMIGAGMKKKKKIPVSGGKQVCDYAERKQRNKRRGIHC